MNTALYEFALAAGALAGVLLSITTLGGRIKRFALWATAPFFAHRRQLKAEILEIRSDIRGLVHELKPNCGTSLRDAVNRIENRQIVFEQRQRAVLTDSHVGVFETDDRGEFVWVNRRLCRIMERTPDELLGAGWLNSVVGGQRDGIQTAWDASILDGREFHRAFSILTPDSVEIPLQMHCVRMTDKEGRVAGYIGFVTPNATHGPCVAN